MKALIDADLFCYSFGNMEELETGGLLPLPITLSLVDANINSILSKVEATSYQLYLTDSSSNFRNQVATILPYKGGRPAEKPPHHAAIKQHLIDNWDAKVCYGIEADDQLGIDQCASRLERMISLAEGSGCTSGTTICSRDKDLDMIPGWHYIWECGKQAERSFFVTETQGLQSFYKQLLTGDKGTDNILGLFGVGKAAACVKRIDTYDNEQEMFEECWLRYQERFGSYAWKFMTENAQLLWILREPRPKFEGRGYDDLLSRLQDQLDVYNERLSEDEGNAA